MLHVSCCTFVLLLRMAVSLLAAAMVAAIFAQPSGECLTPLVLTTWVAERAFPTSDYWGRTGVVRCADEMTGICRDFQYAADPLPNQTAITSKGPFQLPGG